MNIIPRREFMKLIGIIVASTVIPSMEYNSVSLEEAASRLENSIADLCGLNNKEVSVEFFQCSKKHSNAPWIFYLMFSLEGEYGFHATDEWLVKSDKDLLRVFLDDRTAIHLSTGFNKYRKGQGYKGRYKGYGR